MANRELQKYIAEERMKGAGNDLIRAALVNAGWNAGEVDANLNDNAGNDHVGKAGYFLRFGFILFLFTSFLLFACYAEYLTGGDAFSPIIFALFAVTHILNATAAFYLFRALWDLGLNLFSRIFVGLMAAVIAAFALFSLFHLATQLIGTANYMEFFESEDILLLTYWVLLPLQSIVFILLLLLLGILYWRRHKSELPAPSKKLFALLGIFLLMALLAIGDMIMGMDVLGNF